MFSETGNLDITKFFELKGTRDHRYKIEEKMSLAPKYFTERREEFGNNLFEREIDF